MDEELRRDSFVRELIKREGMESAFGVASRSDLRFEWGFAPIDYDPDVGFHERAFRWVGQRGVLRVRSHGDKPMFLSAYGWTNPKVLHTKPVVSLVVDGQFLASGIADATGLYWVGGIVPREMVRGADWLTVDLDFSSVAFHWAEPPELKVAHVLSVTWEEFKPHADAGAP